MKGVFIVLNRLSGKTEKRKASRALNEALSRIYQRESKNPRSHTMHVARLLTQEISLMKDPRNPRQAFERQSKLLKDAFSK